MDQSVIYTKTAKGVAELRIGGKGLSSPLLNMLKLIDGRTSFAGLCAGQDHQEMEAKLAELVTRQLIRIFARREESRETSNADALGESNGLPALHVEELSAEESVRAWAEARRGSRELVQNGFYTTAHISPEGKVSHHRSVLIVEDDPAISMLMKSFLSKRDFTVRVVADGQEALKLLDERPSPNLVLLDVNLPNVNGFDILAYIRADHELGDLPAIMVTAQVSDTDVLRGLKGGADGYIFKPFEWPAFYQCVKRVMRINE